MRIMTKDCFQFPGLTASGTWQRGPDLPSKRGEVRGISTPDETGFMVVGGRSSVHDYHDTILRLECRDLICQWTKMSPKLRQMRVDHVAFWVPGKFC